MKEKTLNLQLFAEDEGMAETNPPATDTADSAEMQNQTATGNETTEPSFDELISGKYKKDFDNRVQGIIKKRFKDNKQLEARAKEMDPVIELFGRKYGINTDNMTDEQRKQIIGKIMEDDSFYEDEAIRRGMDVDTLKTLQKTERENVELRRFRDNTVANMENQRKFEQLHREAEELAEIYPGFDLDAEMENPEFERLTWRAGVPLRTAYEVIHHNEILPAAMQYTAQRTAEQISNSIQSGASRPQEGGMSEQSASLSNGKSPKDWTKEEREAIKNRVRSGERVVL